MTEPVQPSLAAQRVSADQQAAEATDQLVRTALEVIHNTGATPGAVVGGALTAVVRYTIQHLFEAPVPPTVRGVFDLLLPPINRSAEGLLNPPKES